MSANGLKATVKLKHKFRLKIALALLPLVYRLGFEDTAYKFRDWFLTDVEKDIEKYLNIEVYSAGEKLK